MRRAALVFFVLSFGAGATAYALMPPHITRVEPNRGALAGGGRVLRIHGYSLEHAAEPRVETQDSRPIPHRTQMRCHNECHGRNCGPNAPPGAVQRACVLRVTVEIGGTAVGQRVFVRYLRRTIELERGERGYTIVGARTPRSLHELSSVSTPMDGYGGELPTRLFAP